MSDKTYTKRFNRFVGSEGPTVVHYTNQFNRFVGSEGPSVVDSPSQDFPIADIALNTTLDDIKIYLKDELAANSSYSKIWEKAINKYDNDVASGKFEVKAPREFYQGIMTYTYADDEGLQIYSDFNARSRQLTNVSSWEGFPYKSLYCLLAQSINRGVISNPDAIKDKIKIFRGIDFHYPCDEGQVLNFVQFSSFSCSEDQANEFADGHGTVFVVQPPLKTKTALGIQIYSFIENQEEVLVMPWSLFVVKKISTEEDIKKVDLESVDNETVFNFREETRQGRPSLLFSIWTV